MSPWVGASRHAAPYLLQPIEHWDEEADVWQSLVVEIPDPLHQLRGRGHCRRGISERLGGWGRCSEWTPRGRNEWWWVCGRGGEGLLHFRAETPGPLVSQMRFSSALFRTGMGRDSQEGQAYGDPAALIPRSWEGKWGEPGQRRRRKKDGVPGDTFVREAVQTTCDQRLRPLGTVLHQQEQLWRVHAHSPDLQGERRQRPFPRSTGRETTETLGGVRGTGAQGESLGRPRPSLGRCQKPGSWEDAGILEEELARESRS